MSEPAVTHRLRELDALRGIAAVIVVLHHYTWRGVEIIPTAKPIPYGLAWGHYGVELFFAISGFVIFMTLERTRSAADFIISRFARLFPAYWAAIIVTSIAMILLNSPRLAIPGDMILFNFTMLQTYFDLPLVDGVYWTLSTELGFYACMLALWRMGLLARIELVLIGWIALKLVWWQFPGLPRPLGILLVQQYIPWFALGIAVYRVKSGARSWLRQLPLLMAGLGAVALIEPRADVIVYIGVLALLAAMISGWLGTLDNPVLVWLGALSYPLYLVHQNIGYALLAQTQRAGAPPWLALGLAVATALLLALAVHVLVEKPALAAIRGWWKARRAVAPAGTTALI